MILEDEKQGLPEPVKQPGIKLQSLPSEQPIQMSDNASDECDFGKATSSAANSGLDALRPGYPIFG